MNTALSEDRLRFLRDQLGLSDFNQVVERAVKFFDLAVCAHLDGAQLCVRHRDGTQEALDVRREPEATDVDEDGIAL